MVRLRGGGPREDTGVPDRVDLTGEDGERDGWCQYSDDTVW